MNRSNAVGAALLVVGLLLGGLIVERAGAQARTTKSRAWPPEPQDIVSVRLAVAGVQDGDIVKTFDVPTDKWLVLTDFRFDAEGSGSWSHLELGEDFLGTFTTMVGESTGNPGVHFKADRSFSPSGPWSWGEAHIPLISVTGKAFRPGSQVSIRYTNVSDPRDDGIDATVSCNLTGYLTDR
ncbi:MAG: hypothetical protein JNL90_06985 [Planctomycetes bacterium]|nr:hypothetical protein [Planctomycetota bacterium]